MAGFITPSVDLHLNFLHPGHLNHTPPGHGWFHNTFSRSSSQLSPPGSSQPHTSRPLSAESPRESHATNDRAGDQDLAPSTNQVPGITQPMSTPTVISNPEPSSPPVDMPTVAETNKVTNVAWVGLLASLKALEDASGVFGPLASAAGVLLECFDAIETAARSQQDYEDLATELATLSESLTQHFKETTSTTVSKCVSSVAVGIQRQAAEIQKKTERGWVGRLLVAKAEEEDLIRHYRRIQSLFRQLQANLSMSTWSIANEILVDARLKALNPEAKATYDSG
ncbi:hypothetical protein RSAG8_08892, partial [Rhizoctonia solani AG-8 WAC10335]